MLGKAASLNLQGVSEAAYRWEDPDGPETTDMGDIHYLMTPHHALQLASHNEKRASEFLVNIAAEATDSVVSHLAIEMAAEEQEHVNLMEVWLTRYPAPLVQPGIFNHRSGL